MIQLLFIAMVLLVVDYRLTAGNMNVQWNGFGCVRNVVCGKAMLPMQNRIFVPWLTVILGGFEIRAWAYLLVKYLGILFMLFSFYFYLSLIGSDAVLGVVLLAALMPLMILYDYADSYWEMGFFAMLFTLMLGGGSIWLIIPMLVLAILNRETSVILALTTLFATDGLARIALMVIYAVAVCMMMYMSRKRKRYCPFNLVRVNLKEWKKEGFNLLSGYTHSLMLITAFIGFSIVGWSGMPILQPVIITMAVFTVLMIVPSMWRETRVFAPLLLVIIPVMIK